MSFADLKKTFNSVDTVNNLFVFDIGLKSSVKRQLNLKQIKNLSHKFHVSVETFID